MKKANKMLFKCLTLAMATTLALGATGCSLFEKSEEKKEQEFKLHKKEIYDKLIFYLVDIYDIVKKKKLLKKRQLKKLL